MNCLDVLLLLAEKPDPREPAWGFVPVEQRVSPGKNRDNRCSILFRVSDQELLDAFQAQPELKGLI